MSKVVGAHIVRRRNRNGAFKRAWRELDGLTDVDARDAVLPMATLHSRTARACRISIMDILPIMTTETVVFQVGNSLAVRLVGDCKLPRGMRIRERRDGDRIVLEPIIDAWPPDFLAAAGAWKEDIPRPGQDEQPRDPFA